MRLRVLLTVLVISSPAAAQQTTPLDVEECALALTAVKAAGGGPRVNAMAAVLQQRCVVVGKIEMGIVSEALRASQTSEAAGALRKKLERLER